MSVLSRIEKLEIDLKPARGFVIGLFDGESRKAALAEIGLVPAENALVIFINRLAERAGRPRQFSQFEVKS